MAIQLRRGAYADFDPQKMKPAEVAVVQEDDPTSHDGKAVYVAISPGDVKRMAVLDELQDEVYNQIDTAISTATQAAVATATQAAAESASEAAASASAAAESARTLTIDSTLTQAGQAADAKKTGDKITGIKEDLNGIWSEQIIGMVPTEKQKKSVNLFNRARLVASGKGISYVSESTGKAVLQDLPNLDTYIIPVDGESTYTFTNCRSAVGVADLEYTAVGELVTYTTSVSGTGAKYILFCFNTTDYPISEYSITKQVAEYIMPNNWNLWESAVKAQHIDGMTSTGRTIESSNLFRHAQLVASRKYVGGVNQNTGKAYLLDAQTLDTYIIPVDGVSTYTFTNCRTAIVVSDLEYTPVGELLSYTTNIDSAGGRYILFSFSPTTYSVDMYSVIKPVSEYIIPSNWNLGNFKVETQQINGMLPTGKTVESSNLFSKASLVASSKYVDRITNGKAVLSDSTNLDTYIIPVDGESIYTFTNCRTACVVSDLEYTAVGSLLTYATAINSTGGTYILFSFNRNTYPAASYKVTKPVAEYTIPNNWNLEKGTKTGYQRKTGSIASGGSLALTGKTAIKYGYQIIFKAFISAFNEIKLAFYNYNNSAILNAINITATDLVIYAGSTAVETLPHGLTIANDIALILDYRVDGIKITLYSNGESFTTTTTFVRLTSGVVSPSIISTGTVCESAVFEMTVPRAKKPIWYFGDSYISFTNTARWAYYLVNDGFDENTLLNGYAGGTSATTVLALTALLQYGTPEYAVFATGMNDSSDSDSAPSTSWANARDSFISICESNGIEMIFATVPTVPTVNNEQKNAWVRASGYRYIDFASAVGADGTGAWYSGMLSGDNVHPTEKGAKALYTQVLIDLPEVTLK